MKRSLALCLLLALTGLSSVDAARQNKADEPTAEAAKPLLSWATFAGLELRGIGPALTPDRLPAWQPE